MRAARSVEAAREASTVTASATESATERKTPRWVKYILIIAFAIGVGGLVTEQEIEVPLVKGGEKLAPASEVGIKVGMLAPDFALLDLEGNEVKLSDFRGQTVMINFWATWCPPCRDEMPLMEAAYREKADQGFVVLAVSMDDDHNEVTQFVRDHGLTFPVVLDEGRRVSLLYRVRSIPTTFIVDKDGAIRDIQVGAMDRKLILKKLAPIM